MSKTIREWSIPDDAAFPIYYMELQRGPARSSVVVRDVLTMEQVHVYQEFLPLVIEALKQAMADIEAGDG